MPAWRVRIARKSAVEGGERGVRVVCRAEPCVSLGVDRCDTQGEGVHLSRALDLREVAMTQAVGEKPFARHPGVREG